MAPRTSAVRSKEIRRHVKLPKLPSDSKIQKRPLVHPSVPSPYAGSSSPKVVYVRHQTPFMSAVRRVRSLLQKVDSRSAQSVADRVQKTGRDRILAAAMMGIEEASKECVTIKGTGRAVEKVLSLAAYFGSKGKEEGMRVQLETHSIFAIDDISLAEAGAAFPDSRLRELSVLQAKIFLR